MALLDDKEAEKKLVESFSKPKKLVYDVKKNAMIEVTDDEDEEAMLERLEAERKKVLQE